jgi:N4-gp56 family major capsid protein
MASVAVAKVAQGIEITDEAVLSGYGDPMGQGAMQIATAIANCIDNQMLTVLEGIGATMTHEAASSGAIQPSDINDALELFGEDIEDGPTVALVSPAVYTQMRTAVGANTWVPASEIAANVAVRGVVGEFAGCQVMVSNKLKATAAGAGDIFLVKPGALRIFLKRDTLVESDRNIENFTTLLTASKHYVAYLYNAAKAVRIAKKSN